MRLSSLVRRIVAGLSFLVLLFLGVAWIIGQANQVRAKRLLAALQTVRVGITTRAEIYELARRYGGHLRQPCEATLCNVDFPTFQNTLMAKAHLAPATRLGATVTVEDDIASYMAVGFDVTSSMKTIASAEILEFPVGDQRAFPAGGAPFNVVTIWGGAFKPGESDKKWKTIIRMTPDAPPKLQKVAFAFNLTCFTRLGGCTDSTELLPGVAHLTFTGAK